LNEGEQDVSVAVEENFFSKNWEFVRHALSFPLFRTYLIIYVLSNSSLVLMGSMINMVVMSVGADSVG
jgi:hypothetical protein